MRASCASRASRALSLALDGSPFGRLQLPLNDRKLRRADTFLTAPRVHTAGAYAPCIGKATLQARRVPPARSVAPGMTEARLTRGHRCVRFRYSGQAGCAQRQGRPPIFARTGAPPLAASGRRGVMPVGRTGVRMKRFLGAEKSASANGALWHTVWKKHAEHRSSPLRAAQPQRSLESRRYVARGAAMDRCCGIAGSPLSCRRDVAET